MKTTKLFLFGAMALTVAGFSGIPAQAAEVEGWGSFKLYLDPGHSGHENQGLWGYSEAEKVLAVALNVQDMLKTYTDIPDDCLRLCRYTENESKTLEERTDEANAWGADFYYSIHSDASGNNNTTVTLFGGWRKNGVEIEKTPNGGKAFGEILNPNLTNAMRITTRGNYYDRCYYYPSDETHANQYPYLHVNRESNMPSLLSEGGYHTIASQQQLNINADYKRIEAFAAFRSILKYRGLNCPVQTFLTGIITNSENDVPINGVTVTVDGKTYTTDTWESVFNKYTRNPNLIHNGYYFFEGLTGGQEYEVTFAADGFNTETRTVTIKQSDDGEAADNITFLDMQMTSHAPARVDGISVSDFTAVNPTKPVTITFSRNMNRESVEQATSINRGEIGLSWDNDYTLNIDVSQLSNIYRYTLTIDGSIAKNSQTNQFFDGDGDGTEGGNYVIEFTMAEPDVEAPYVVSADPTPEGEALFTRRPPIRIEFNEELAWNDDLHANLLSVTDKDGNSIAGTVSHAVVREASVVHFYPNEDLPLDRTLLVVLAGGIPDLSGNVSDQYAFRFMTEYRDNTYTTIRNLDDTNEFWAPDGSGSTKGLTQDANFWRAVTSPVYSKASPGACQLIYDFDEDSSDNLWQIREYWSKSTNSTNKQTSIDGILAFWFYGDGSNNHITTNVRANTTGGGLKHPEETQEINFRGWKHVKWDMKNDPYVAFTGVDQLTGIWYFDSFFLTHEYTDPDDEEITQQAWRGTLYFDELQFIKAGTGERTAQLTDVTIPESGVDNAMLSRTIISRNGDNITIANARGIDIYSISGAKVARSLGDRINVGNLNAGVYLVRATIDGKCVVAKIVK